MACISLEVEAMAVWRWLLLLTTIMICAGNFMNCITPQAVLGFRCDQHTAEGKKDLAEHLLRSRSQEQHQQFGGAASSWLVRS